ncbi:hypothetical protein RFI_24927 [Reticulomyxa filosa]|uniref:Sfi1 spindle body domain-containing protein n=1 Tax=Reticulomyxa filosa TaxID=46433 RepID=X6MFM5_RETFI|nr:hypothetical protein RFI_24927 [Reticulomyxa filosa]|eukprot:ETO12446.1 hypothetical protein RFI_24927 [Reticulomyxa filosa]
MCVQKQKKRHQQQRATALVRHWRVLHRYYQMWKEVLGQYDNQWKKINHWMLQRDVQCLKKYFTQWCYLQRLRKVQTLYTYNIIYKHRRCIRLYTLETQKKKKKKKESNQRYGIGGTSLPTTEYSQLLVALSSTHNATQTSTQMQSPRSHISKKTIQTLGYKNRAITFRESHNNTLLIRSFRHWNIVHQDNQLKHCATGHYLAHLRYTVFCQWKLRTQSKIQRAHSKLTQLVKVLPMKEHQRLQSAYWDQWKMSYFQVVQLRGLTETFKSRCETQRIAHVLQEWHAFFTKTKRQQLAKSQWTKTKRQMIVVQCFNQWRVCLYQRETKYTSLEQTYFQLLKNQRRRYFRQWNKTQEFVSKQKLLEFRKKKKTLIECYCQWKEQWEYISDHNIIVQKFQEIAALKHTRRIFSAWTKQYEHKLQLTYRVNILWNQFHRHLLRETLLQWKFKNKWLKMYCKAEKFERSKLLKLFWRQWKVKYQQRKKIIHLILQSQRKQQIQLTNAYFCLWKHCAHNFRHSKAVTLVHHFYFV